MNIKSFFKKYSKPSKKGMTLVELIAVITILAITSTATLSVYLMVQSVTNDASKITVDQYNTSSTERLIKNEVQVASNIDIATVSNFELKDDGIVENDEYIAFNQEKGTMSFMRADEDGNFQKVFSISGVDKVEFSIVPVDNSALDTTGQHYKLFYQIKTFHYDYSGGFILNNTTVGEDDSMKLANMDVDIDPVKVEWVMNGGDEYDNDKAICFHRETIKSTV